MVDSVAICVTCDELFAWREPMCWRMMLVRYCGIVIQACACRQFCDFPLHYSYRIRLQIVSLGL